MSSDAPKSCADCPSFLTADEAQTYFKKNIGSPMCARYGYILGKPGLKPAQAARIQSHYAENCGDFGNARPLDPPKVPATRVSIGDPDVLAAGPAAEADRTRVTTCLECKHFVRPDVVQNELGWPTGLCAANGRLILPNRTSLEARDCNMRAPGGNRLDTSGILLMPVYEEAFSMDANPVAVYLKKRKQGAEKWWTEPTEYVTDRPVEAVDAAAGIRAWRRIDDPEGESEPTFLPIYDPEFFEPAARAKIPVAGSDEHPELYVDYDGAVYDIAATWRDLDETPMVWGEPGTGKTERFRHLAWLMQLPFQRISLTAKSEVDDVIGKMGAVEAESGTGVVTRFKYGRIPEWYSQPCVLLLDEPNTAPDEIWQTIRPMVDNSKQLVIDQNEGERIDRHPDCYLGMAANPSWDERNIGTNPMADADGNRLVHLMATLPPAEIERTILLDRCAVDGYTPETDVLDAIMGIAEDIRGMAADNALPISWGIRPQIKVLRATRKFSTLKAYRVAVLNYLEPETARVIESFVKQHLGVPVD